MSSLLDDFTKQYNILKAIANTFLSVHEIDLEKMEITEFNSTKDLKRYIKYTQGNAIDQMNEILLNLVTKADHDRVFEFNDLNTLAERLAGKEYLEDEFIGTNVGWFKEKYIPIEYDKDGNITKVILLTEVIEKQKRREEELLQAAYVDELTKLFNRRSYEKDLYDGRADLDDFIYVSLDLNGLKPINDELGHQYGDSAIRVAARAIFSTFRNYGDVYRTGGDEYVALLNCSVKTLEKRINHLKTLLERWSTNSIFECSVSVGYASKEENPEATLDDLIAISDNNMYLDKALYYETHPEVERRGGR